MIVSIHSICPFPSFGCFSLLVFVLFVGLCFRIVVEGSKTEAPVTVITMKANPEASVFATVRLDVLSYPFQKCTSSSTPHHSSKDEDRAWEVFDGNGMMMEELQNDASARMKTWDREGGYGALSRLCSLLHDVCSSMS